MRRPDNDEASQESADLGSRLGDEEETTVPEDAEDSPREQPLAVEDYGITGAEEEQREPLAARLRREVPERHRPVDPDRGRFAGRLEQNDGVHVALQDTGGYSAEEAAVHEVPTPRSAAPRRQTVTSRVELLEAEVSVLLTTAQVLVEAVSLLASGLEQMPTEEPGEHAERVAQAAHRAHDLLLAARRLRE